MDYKDIYDKLLSLEREKIEYFEKEHKKEFYFSLFQISINIFNRLIYLRKLIKELKKA